MNKLFPILLVPFVAGLSFPAIAATSDVPIGYAERGLRFPVSRKGATINITTGKITDVAISDKSCVVYSQVQNSIYVKALSPCLQFEGVGSPDRNPTLRVWVDSKILEFNVCSGCPGSRNISIVPERSLAPVVKPTLRSTNSLIVPKAPKVKTPIAIAPPPPETDPTVMVQENFSADQGPTGKAYPLLKPIPQIAETPKEVLRPRRKKARKSEKFVPKEDVKPIEVVEPEKSQPVDSPSQRAIAEINSIVIQPSPTVTIQKPIETKKAIVKTKKIQSFTKHRTTFKLALNQSQAKALLKGLNIARLKKGEGHISYRSRDWMAIQDTIYFLKINKSLDTAIKKSGASKPLVEKLMTWGGFDV